MVRTRKNKDYSSVSLKSVLTLLVSLGLVSAGVWYMTTEEQRRIATEAVNRHFDALSRGISDVLATPEFNTLRRGMAGVRHVGGVVGGIRRDVSGFNRTVREFL